MSKITLVSHTGDFSSFSAGYLHNVLDEYFNCELFDSSKTYNKASTLFVTNCINQTDAWYLPYYNNGYKVLIDALWEKPPIKTELKNARIISNDNWFWYNESIWYEYLKYNDYIPNRSYEKTALLLMRKETPQRTLLVNQLGNLLTDFLYSYTSRGIFLNNDKIIN